MSQDQGIHTQTFNLGMLELAFKNRYCILIIKSYHLYFINYEKLTYLFMENSMMHDAPVNL